MNPGTLDQQITLATQSVTADAYGGGDLVWTTLATVWANVKPLTGRERAEVGAVEAPAMYRFKIRRRGDVPDTVRIGWNGQTYNARFVSDPGSRSLYMTVDAERGVAQ